MYFDLLNVLYSIYLYAKFQVLSHFTTRQELEPDYTAYYLILSGLSVLTVLVFVVYKLYNSPPKQETASISDDTETESLENLSIIDLENKLIEAARVVERYSRTRQVKFDQELSKVTAKLIDIKTKFRNTYIADFTVGPVFSVADDLQRSLRTKQGGLQARKKFADSVFGCMDHGPAEAMKSASRRSRSKPTQKGSTPVNHTKRRSLTSDMPTATQIANTNRATNKTGYSCRQKDSMQAKVSPTKTLPETSAGRRQTARMEYPYLFERLVLTKKSAVEAATLPSSPKTRRRHRKYVSKQDWCDTNAAKANIASEPDLRNQDPAFSKVVGKGATSDEKLTYSLQETDNPVFGMKTNAVRHTESNESYDCTVLLPAQSRQFELTACSSEDTLELNNAAKLASLNTKSKNSPSDARNASSANISRQQSLSPKRRDNPLKDRVLNRNRDLAPGSWSSSFYRRKLYDNTCKLKDTVPTNDSNSYQDRLPLAKRTYLSSNGNVSHKSIEKQEKPQIEGSSSNRGRFKSTDKQNDSTKTNSSGKTHGNSVKNHLKDHISNLGRPVSCRNGAVDLAVEARQEIEQFFYRMKHTYSQNEKLTILKKEKLTSNLDRSEKSNVDQETQHLEGSCLNQGRPKLNEKQDESWKTKSCDKNQENHTTTEMENIVSNLGRPRSAQKVRGDGSIRKRNDFEAPNPLKENTSKHVELQILKKADSSSSGMTSVRRSDKQDNPQMERRFAHHGRPKTPENQVELTKTKSSYRKQELHAKNHKNDSNVGRPKPAQKESVVFAGEKRKASLNNNDIITSKDRPKSAGRQDLSPFEKRKECQAKFHLKSLTSNVGRS